MPNDYYDDPRDRGMTYLQSYERVGPDAVVKGSVSRVQDVASVRPGTTFEIEFFARDLPIDLSISATRGDGPLTPPTGPLARIRLSEITPQDPFGPNVLDPGQPPFPPDNTITSYQAAVTVQLYPPDGSPARVWNFAEGFIDGYARRLHIPEGLPDPSLRGLVGWWRCAITPTSEFPVRIALGGAGTIATVPTRATDVSGRLLNRIFVQALDALALNARFKDSALQVWMSDEIADILGRPREIAAYGLPSAIHTAPSLQTLAVEVVTAQRCFDRLALRIARCTDDDTRQRLLIKQSHLHNTHLATDVAVRIQAGFSDVDVTTYFGIDLVSIDGDAGEIFLVFSQDLRSVMPVALLTISFGSLPHFFEALGFIDVPDVESPLESELEKYGTAIATYFRGALSRVVGRDQVAAQARWIGDAIHVDHFVDPPRPTRANTAPPPPAPPPTVVFQDPLGEFPPGFQVAGGAALARLDRSSTLVMIMMENRSFDHLLGDLSRARSREGDAYDGIPAGGATNARAGGFAERVPMVAARALGLDTQIPVGPHHRYDPVTFQIGDGSDALEGRGAMDGFARELARVTDSPQIAMTYYTEADLPIYYRLADEQMVCDRWFCSLPGPTWPNRWITYCGTTPSLDNPELDEPQLGYMTERTFFDTLTEHGIEWKIFEGDLSLIRLFDRYRIDDTNVLPLTALDGVLGRSGPLPRVMVIEPNFLDVPGGLANDDHPPADLADGQTFIAGILDKFRAHNRWHEVTIVITYDEHGGFYDHVPPPGNPHGDPAWIGGVPRIHPDGPDWLGVRVPTFIVSPYVGGPSISHVVFDHTSFLKSVLVHNRARLPRSAFTRFGARVDKAAHLGQALTRDTPKAAPTVPFSTARTAGGGGSPNQPPPGEAAWIDPASDRDLVFNDRLGLFVHTGTGWLVEPGSGRVLDPRDRRPIAADLVTRAAGAKVATADAPARARWRDPAHKGMVRDAASGALVDTATGYYLDPAGVLREPNGALADPARAAAVLGDRVQIVTVPATPGVGPLRRPRLPRVVEPRDFHEALRALFKPRRRYA